MTITRRLLFLSLGFLCVFGSAAASFFWKDKREEGITIGAKGGEGEILGEIIVQLIESHLPIKVHRKFHFDGTSIIFHALCTNQVDLYVEYTGTALSAILREKSKGKSKGEILDRLNTVFLKKYDLIWLDSLGFENAYALMMEPEVASQFKIATLSDLGKVMKDNPILKIGLDQEFFGRDEIKLLKENYGMDFSHVKLMDHLLLYLSLNRKGCDVINGYTTDGFCQDLLILEDDQKVFPSYEAIPLVRREILEKHPQLRGVLGKLKNMISQKEMAQMNYAMEKKGASVYDVAHNFLKRHDLLAS